MEAGFSGAMIIDDPLKPEDAERPLARANINRRWDTTLKSRLAHEDVPVIVIMQRLHQEDFSGFLLRGQGGCHWHHLCLPAVIDQKPAPKYSHARPIAHGLPPGPLWPEKLDQAGLKALQADAYTYSAQYMQRPGTRGGSLFRSKWLKSYTHLPTLEYRMIFADTAQKTGQEHDYSVFQCWGKEHGGPNIYLIDQLRGKWEEPDLIDIAKRFWRKHDDAGHEVVLGRLRAMAIEDKVSGTALIQYLRRAGIPVQAITRTRDKRTRARDVTPVMACGYVHLPKYEDWYGEYETAILSFPKGPHHDQGDPTMVGIAHMCRNGTSLNHIYTQ